ncbi:cytochrome P450 2U1 [Aplysia californica]|uniref:Cytochrome P450 2U1 n=1 Tax=Aplysia californica TaxID=6500 RepID=A0ABM1VY05_APLCA|nr:cytochrome P450 2U1 [Aplysia californica]
MLAVLDIGEGSLQTVLLGLLFALCVLTVFNRWSQNSPRLPPSPGLALPVVGHLYLLEANPRQQFLKWGEKLGPMFRLYMGNNLVIVLHGYDVIREALVTHADKFSNRPSTYISSLLAKNSGFVTPGTSWVKHRKVSTEILRKLGQSTGAVEQKVQKELRSLLSSLHAQTDCPLDASGILSQSVSSVFYSVLFGPDFRFEDPETESCMKLVAEQACLLEGMIALDFLPFLRYLPGDLFGLKKTLEVREYVDSHLIRRQVASRREQSCTEEPEDFITYFLKNQDMQNGKNPELNEDSLVAIVFTLLIAAIDTTSISLSWAILYLLHHPEVQERCFQEMKDSIGLDRRPEFKDCGQLPYLEATILEVLRRASISPFSIHHTVTEDVILRGFLVPKDTIIMPSLDSALLSANVWGDPYNFRPERFLDDTGKRLVVKEQFIPFCIGPRSCFGEKLAKMVLMLFLSSVLQEFQIRSPPDTPLPSLKDTFGLNCIPQPFKVLFVPR